MIGRAAILIPVPPDEPPRAIDELLQQVRRQQPHALHLGYVDAETTSGITIREVQPVEFGLAVEVGLDAVFQVSTFRWQSTRSTDLEAGFLDHLVGVALDQYLTVQPCGAKRRLEHDPVGAQLQHLHLEQLGAYLRTRTVEPLQRELVLDTGVGNAQASVDNGVGNTADSVNVSSEPVAGGEDFPALLRGFGLPGVDDPLRLG